MVMMANTDKKSQIRLSSSSSSTGNSISDIHKGSSNSSLPQYLCLFAGTFSELLIKANQKNPN